MGDKLKNEKTYDSVFWTSVVKMKEYLVPLVNEAFGAHYTENAVVTLDSGKLMTEFPDGNFSHREMDAIAKLTENGQTKDYHVEVESSKDKTFAIRIAEYAAGKAYKSVELTELGAKMVIPYSAVIFLRAENEVPDEFIIEIDYPGGTASYIAPILKVKNYSVSEIFDKKLLLLLPFYGFNYDNRFKDMNESGIEELKDALDGINNRLVDMVVSGEINETQHSHLIDWMKRVLEKLTINYSNVMKEVNEIMGGYILHTRTDDILDQGRAEGREEGRAEGTDNTIISTIKNLMKNLHISATQAMESMGLTSEQQKRYSAML